MSLAARLRQQHTAAEHEQELVRALGEQIGYGNLMYLAATCWRESAARRGDPPGGEFTIGPSMAETVACGCEHPVGCHWCCGTGRVVRRVKRAKGEREDALKERILADGKRILRTDAPTCPHGQSSHHCIECGTAICNLCGLWTWNRYDYCHEHRPLSGMQAR